MSDLVTFPLLDDQERGRRCDGSLPRHLKSDDFILVSTSLVWWFWPRNSFVFI